MTRPTLLRSLACAALLLAAGAPALAAQDVVEAGRAHGIAPTPELLRLLQEDSTAFEFQRAWRQKTQRVRVQRAALEQRQGPRLSTDQLEAAQAAVTGTLRVPVLMGLYAGATAPYPQSDYQTRLFGPQQYSARTFYQEMSRGAFTLDGTVTPWITLPQNAAYYQPNAATDPRYGRAGEYLRHTLQGADAAMDFGQFDNDGPDGVPNSGDDDGYVDAAAFVYPAVGMSCGGPGIWPHRWVYRAWFGAPFTTGDARTGGGFILVDDYLIQGGLECDGAGLMQIGTFSHEMGHALGLPDLYDTYANDGTSSGLGEWDLMASGNWRLQDAPAHMGAWSKDYLGWVNVETVTASRAVTLAQVYAAGTVLRYDLPGTPEYFLMENRGAVGSDRNLRRAGLLVYHIDPAVIDSTRGWNRVNGHPRMGVALEQADGANDLGSGANRGDMGDPFPGATARTTFGDTGTPNTRSNSATASDLELRNIALNATTNAVAFDLVVGSMLTAPGTARLRSRADAEATLQIAVATSSGTPVGVRARKALGSAWLTVSPDTTTAPGVLTLTARGAGLAPGVYRDTVLITSSAAANSPFRTVVEYTVQPGTLVPGDSVAGRAASVGQRDTMFVQAGAGDVLDFAIFEAGTGTYSPTMTLISPAGASQVLPVVTTGGLGGVRRGRVSIGRTLPTAGVWRVVLFSSQGTGDYVFKVRPAGPVPAVEPTTRVYVPVPVNGATGRDTVWVGNAGTGTMTPVVSAVGADWLAVGSPSAAAGAPRAPAPSGPALAAPGRLASASAAEAEAAADDAGTPPASHAGSSPVVLTATRGTRTQGDYTGYVAVQTADGWAGPAMVEVRMRVHEREVVFLTPGKMASRPVALAVAPEGDLGVVLVNGQVVRMDPVTGATRPWATTTTSAWWGMSFGPDSAAYIAEFQRVTRVARNGTTSIALTIAGTVFDVVVTPAGDLFAASDQGLWRVPRGGTASRVFTEGAYGVAYNAGDGMVYASMLSTQTVRRVNPATGTVTATLTASDNSIQQQVEIGEGGKLYGRSYYLDYPDLRRFTPDGQLDRSWWTPQPFPQAMALAPDGTMYATAGDRVFRLRVEGTPPVTHVAGDATGDGTITAQDALAVLSAAVGKTLPEGWTAAYGDANCDGEVTAQDALIILSHAVGKDVAQFCVGTPQP